MGGLDLTLKMASRGSSALKLTENIRQDAD